MHEDLVTFEDDLFGGLELHEGHDIGHQEMLEELVFITNEDRTA